jgi:hypothetical protein
MDEQIIFPLPKSSKVDGIVSLRVQKYTRIYSARRSNSREVNKKSVKHSEAESLTIPQKSSIDVSRISFNSDSVQNLQKVAKSLLYDVQKAESDRVELIRDLSTFEHNFAEAVKLKEKLKIFLNLSEPLPDMVDMIELNTKDENFCYNRISEGLLKISITETSKESLVKSEIEDFNLRKPSLTHVLKTVFKGICLISGVYMTVTLMSDQWLENLLFRVLSIEGKSYSLNLKQKISNLQSKEHSLLEIKQKLLPCLCLAVENGEISLIFNKLQGKDHYCMITQVKGFHLCNVIASKKSETQTLLEIPELEQSIFIEKTLNFSDNSLKTLTKEVKSHLFFSVTRNLIFWGSSSDLFVIKEKTSKFMNEEFIKSATQDMGNFTQAYSFEVGLSKVSCFTDREKVLMQLSRNKVSEEFNNDSKNFSFLESLQYVNVRAAPVTLSKSLELEYLLSKLFPQ